MKTCSNCAHSDWAKQDDRWLCCYGLPITRVMKQQAACDNHKHLFVSQYDYYEEKKKKGKKR